MQMTEKDWRRFWKQIEITDDGCWQWRGSDNGTGYCQFSIDGKHVLIHRLTYLLFIGEIPHAYEVDHKVCNNTRCCCPFHLEACTSKENNMRSASVGARNAAKTHCPQGHPYDEENTYQQKGRYGTIRRCRTCVKAQQAKRCHRKKSRIISH